MNEMLTAVYWFWPNPGNADYTSLKSLVLLGVCVLLVITSFVLPQWRKKQNPQMRKLSSSWAMACGWFGWIGLFLVVARVEGIQYIAMRMWWVVWGLSLLAYVFLQMKFFRSRYYEILPSEPTNDARAQYIPKRKKR